MSQSLSLLSYCLESFWTSIMARISASTFSAGMPCTRPESRSASRRSISDSHSGCNGVAGNTVSISRWINSARSGTLKPMAAVSTASKVVVTMHLHSCLHSVYRQPRDFAINIDEREPHPWPSTAWSYRPSQYALICRVKMVSRCQPSPRPVSEQTLSKHEGGTLDTATYPGRASNKTDLEVLI